MSEVEDETPAATTVTTPTGTPRRRPRLASPLAVLAGVALLVVAIGGKWLYDRRAAQRAALTTASAEVLQQVDERYESIEEAARACIGAATPLGVTLQEHLVVSQPERTDAQLIADRQVQRTALASAGKRLLDVASAPPPEVPPLADEPVARPHLKHLAELQRNATKHGRQLITFAAASERWGAAITRLRAEAQRYVDVANADRNTQGDPAALRRQWERERTVLERYRAAALAAEEVSGLRPYADAFLAYIDGTRAFIDEAVMLLGQGQIDRYNQRLQAVFGVDDPFRFNDALAAATSKSLRSGLLLDITQARNATNSLIDAASEARGALDPLLESRQLAG